MVVAAYAMSETVSSVVWDLDTVSKVSGLWSSQNVAEEMLVSDRDGVVSAIRSHLARWIVNEAHTFAVEVDPNDVHIVAEASAPELFAVKFTAAWRPETTEVELVGAGPDDGRIVHIAHVGSQFRVPVTKPLTLYGDERPELGIAVDVYELAGWREVERRWTYRRTPQ